MTAPIPQPDPVERMPNGGGTTDVMSGNVQGTQNAIISDNVWLCGGSTIVAGVPAVIRSITKAEQTRIGHAVDPNHAPGIQFATTRHTHHLVNANRLPRYINDIGASYCQ